MNDLDHMPVEVQPTALADGPAVDPGQTAPTAAHRPARRPARARRWLEDRALLIVGICAVAAISFLEIPAHLSQDGWLALVAGRIIAQHGIPYHDYLTVMAHGVRWIDQQWLAQLAIYGLQQIGGLALFTVVYVVLTTAGFAMSIVAARRLGAAERHIIWMLPIGAFFYLTTAVEIRTQGFAYPLFVATLWLLAADVRRPSERRVYLVLPILLLWANLHGSVTLGAGMAVLYGLTLLVAGFRARGLSGLAHRRGLVFLVGPLLCLLATPYGLSIVSYYHSTLFNSSFGKLVAEWQPVTGIAVLAVPLLLLIVFTIWILGRSGRRTPAFEHLILIVLALGAVDAVRNVTWFGLAVVILLPATLTRLRPRGRPSRRHAQLDLSLAVGALLLSILIGIVTLAKPASWFESTYPKATPATVARLAAAHPQDKIFADVRYADWLIWHEPQLAGRLAYDTSFENLTLEQLTELNSLAEAVGPGMRDPIGPYSILVLYPVDKTVNKILLSRPGTRVLVRNKRVLIATKPPRAR